MLAGARSLDGGVEAQEIRLLGDFVDEVDDLDGLCVSLLQRACLRNGFLPRAGKLACAVGDLFDGLIYGFRCIGDAVDVFGNFVQRITDFVAGRNDDGNIAVRPSNGRCRDMNRYAVEAWIERRRCRAALVERLLYDGNVAHRVSRRALDLQVFCRCDVEHGFGRRYDEPRIVRQDGIQIGQYEFEGVDKLFVRLDIFRQCHREVPPPYQSFLA